MALSPIRYHEIHFLDERDMLDDDRNRDLEISAGRFYDAIAEPLAGPVKIVLVMDNINFPGSDQARTIIGAGYVLHRKQLYLKHGPISFSDNRGMAVYPLPSPLEVMALGQVEQIASRLRNQGYDFDPRLFNRLYELVTPKA